MLSEPSHWHSRDEAVSDKKSLRYKHVWWCFCQVESTISQQLANYFGSTTMGADATVASSGPVTLRPGPNASATAVLLRLPSSILRRIADANGQGVRLVMGANPVCDLISVLRICFLWTLDLKCGGGYFGGSQPPCVLVLGLWRWDGMLRMRLLPGRPCELSLGIGDPTRAMVVLLK